MKTISIFFLVIFISSAAFADCSFTFLPSMKNKGEFTQNVLTNDISSEFVSYLNTSSAVDSNEIYEAQYFGEEKCEQLTRNTNAKFVRVLKCKDGFGLHKMRSWIQILTFTNAFRCM